MIMFFFYKTTYKMEIYFRCGGIQQKHISVLLESTKKNYTTETCFRYAFLRGQFWNMDKEHVGSTISKSIMCQ